MCGSKGEDNPYKDFESKRSTNDNQEVTPFFFGISEEDSNSPFRRSLRLRLNEGKILSTPGPIWQFVVKENLSNTPNKTPTPKVKSKETSKSNEDFEEDTENMNSSLISSKIKKTAKKSSSETSAKTNLPRNGKKILMFPKVKVERATGRSLRGNDPERSVSKNDRTDLNGKNNLKRSRDNSLYKPEEVPAKRRRRDLFSLS